MADLSSNLSSPSHPPSQANPLQAQAAPVRELVGDDGLAAALEPALLNACQGRLSKLEWFRSTWQSGGASTGFGTYTGEDGRPHAACVKLPVGPTEYNWTTALSALNGHADAALGDRLPTLRVFAAGQELGGYDLAWLVVERLPGNTLSHEMPEQAVQDLLRATAKWYQLAAMVRPIGPPPAPPDWEGQLHKAREALKVSAIDNAQHWNTVLKHVHKVLPRLVERWMHRPINTWCHGDLHPGNVMRRVVAGAEPDANGTPNGQSSSGASAEGQCVLIDLALVHAGHWVEDAVYLERLHWGRPEALHGIKPVNALNKARKELGLPHAEGEDHGMLANVRRVLMAATTPAFLHREGNPKYVRAALEKLETLLPLVSK